MGLWPFLMLHKQSNMRVKGLGVGVVTAIAVLWHFPTCDAAATLSVTGKMQPEVRVFDGAGSLKSKFTAYAEGFRGGVRVAIADVNGDGVNEIITAPGAGGGPEVKTFTLNGIQLSRFFAYDAGFRGGVNVAAYDLDGDRISEIITGPGASAKPEVRVFKQDGTLVSSFFAYDAGFRGGVNVTAGAFGNHGEALIATGSGFGGSQVVLYTPKGRYAGLSLRPFGKSMFGVIVTAVPMHKGRAMLAVAQERLSSSTTKVFDLSSPNKVRSEFAPFDAKYRGGIQISSADVDNDGVSEIIAAIGPGKTPRVKVFTAEGHQLFEFLSYQKKFTGGSNLAASGAAMVTGPRAVSLDGRTDLYKYINVNLTSQMLTYYENGLLKGVHRVSTGKWSTPTPIGTFAIKNKIPIAYSKPYDLYMEWWMAFTPDGSYGLHALPFWKQKNGGKRYEGVGHIGTPVSHGCIRQSLEEAKALYQWVDIGTPVIVTR